MITKDGQNSKIRLSRAIKGALLWPHYALRDRGENMRWKANSGSAKFLIVRHPGKSPYFHDYYLKWMSEEVPHLRRDFRAETFALSHYQSKKLPGIGSLVAGPG